MASAEGSSARMPGPEERCRTVSPTTPFLCRIPAVCLVTHRSAPTVPGAAWDEPPRPVPVESMHRKLAPFLNRDKFCAALFLVAPWLLGSVAGMAAVRPPPPCAHLPDGAGPRTPPHDGFASAPAPEGQGQLHLVPWRRGAGWTTTFGRRGGLRAARSVMHVFASPRAPHPGRNAARHSGL